MSKVLILTKSILRSLAREVLGEEKSREIWKRIDIIGDIAIIKKPFNIDIETLRPLGEALVQKLSYIRSVWLDLGGVEEITRTRNLVWLAGEKRSETVYREHGCLFKLDITKTYISPRLSYEHIRIARLVRENEYIANLFAGVGGFSIIIAKYSRPREVVSIDISEDAYRYMVENIRLNKVEDVVKPVLGDALEIIESYSDYFDRILLPLPRLALVAIKPSIRALKKRGYLHPYDFVSAKSKSEAIEISREAYSREIEKMNSVKNFRIEYSRVVRSVGPRRYQVVHDIWVEKI